VCPTSLTLIRLPVWSLPPSTMVGTPARYDCTHHLGCFKVYRSAVALWCRGMLKSQRRTQAVRSVQEQHI